MKSLHVVTFILLIVGGINWGLIGFGGWNIVNMLLGSMPMVEQLVYILVGLSAIYLLFSHKRACRECSM